MKLENFNLLTPENAQEELLKCCGCKTWASRVLKHFPFSSVEQLKNISDEVWMSCKENDWLEAFSHHPKIGQKAMEKKFESTKSWAENEQSGTKNADENTLRELMKTNVAYENKFGYIFIVCASGKSAREMLALLKERINNDAEKELLIAAREQNKITHLRIDKLLA